MVAAADFTGRNAEYGADDGDIRELLEYAKRVQRPISVKVDLLKLDVTGSDFTDFGKQEITLTITATNGTTC